MKTLHLPVSLRWLLQTSRCQTDPPHQPARLASLFLHTWNVSSLPLCGVAVGSGGITGWTGTPSRDQAGLVLHRRLAFVHDLS